MKEQLYKNPITKLPKQLEPRAQGGGGYYPPLEVQLSALHPSPLCRCLYVYICIFSPFIIDMIKLKRENLNITSTIDNRGVRVKGGLPPPPETLRGKFLYAPIKDCFRCGPCCKCEGQKYGQKDPEFRTYKRSDE